MVTDAAGRPLPEVRVVLEASRAVFSFREFHRTLHDTRRVAGVTDAKGQFSLTWPWDGYFNYFDLVAGVPVRTPDGERFEVLTRKDVTARLQKANPLVVTLAVENADFVRTLRTFLAVDRHRRRAPHLPADGQARPRGGARHGAHLVVLRAGPAPTASRDGTLVEVKTFDPVEKL